MSDIAETPQEILRHLNFEWRQELRAVSLIAELELDKQNLNTALFCIGNSWKKFGASLANEFFVKDVPAAFAVGLAGSASLHHTAGNIWPPLLEVAGLRNDANVSSGLGKTFLSCLRALELPTFDQLDDEKAQKYVSRMLLHGGVSLDNLDEWFNVASSAVKKLGGVDADVLQDWMACRAEVGLLYGSTMPIERFVRFGGSFAADFLDRSLDLLDEIRSGRAVDDIRVRLPRRYLERAVEIREQGLLPEAIRAAAAAGTPGLRIERPQVRFDPYGIGVHVWLPSVRTELGFVTWDVAIGGDMRSVRAPSSSPGLPSEETSVALPSSATSVEVRRHGMDAVELPAIDPDNPLLLFDANGKVVSRSGRVTTDTLWAVHPSDVPLGVASEDVVEEHPSVARWSGWEAKLLRVDGMDNVGLEGRRARSLATVASAALVDLDVVSNVRVDGSTAMVLRSWPSIRLPQDLDTDWELSLSVDGTTHELTGGSAGRQSTEVAGLAEQVVTVRARGPLGRSLVQDIIVVPGLAVTTTPSVRTPGEKGLSPTKIEFGGVDRDPLVLEPSQRAVAVTLPSGVSLLVEPPHVQVRHITDERATDWSISPVELDAEMLADAPGLLVVQLPQAESATLALRAEGAVVQEVTSTRPSREGHHPFDLTKFLDTLAAHPASVLTIESSVWQQGRAATIRPGRLAGDVLVAGGGAGVVVVDPAVDGLEIALWARLAPFNAPTVAAVPLDGAMIPLPEDLLGAGPLRAMVRIPDPWAPEPWPLFPRPGRNTFDVNPAFHSEVLRWLHPLARFLACETEVVSTDADLGDVLRTYVNADHLNVPRAPDAIRGKLGEILMARPVETIAAAVERGLDGAELASALCGSGLVAAPIETSLDIEVAEQLMQRWPAAGVLALTSALRRGEDDSLTKVIEARCGHEVTDLLTGNLPLSASHPRVDGTHYLGMQRAVLEAAFQAAGIAPKFPLDPDARAVDAKWLVYALQDAPQDGELWALAKDAEPLLAKALGVLQVMAPRLAEAVEERRREPTGWPLLPALSLALASIARLAARSDAAIKHFHASRRVALERLSRAVPSMVSADLVIAELFLVGRELQGDAA